MIVTDEVFWATGNSPAHHICPNTISSSDEPRRYSSNSIRKAWVASEGDMLLNHVANHVTQHARRQRIKFHAFTDEPLITAPDAVAAAGYGDGCARRQFLSWRCVVHRRRRRRTWSANPSVDRSCRRRRGYREQRRRAGLRLRRRAIECSAAFRGFDGMCRWWKFRTCSHAAPKNETASELHQKKPFTKLIRPSRINLLAFASRAAVASAARSAAAAERRAGPSASRRSRSSLRRICPQRVNP